MGSAWRLTMDEPVVQVIEPGCIKDFHAYDLQEKESTTSGTWQEPVTGCIMLRPSFLREDWYKGTAWKPLTDWTTSADWWEQVYRGNAELAGDVARFWGSIYSPDISTPYNDISGTIPSVIGMEAVVGATMFGAALQDTLVPCALSNFSLARDEGFVWHVRFEIDELHRFRNLLYLQWGELGFHLASDGTLTAAYYPSGASAPAVGLDSVDIGQLGRIHNRDLYLVFLPIPGHGIVVHVTTSAPKVTSYTSAVSSGATLSSHLFRFPPLQDGANFYVHDGGPITVFSLPVDTLPDSARLRYSFGYHPIRYQSEGTHTFVGPVFDWGYIPTQAPTVLPLKVPDGRGTVAGDLVKSDGTTAWAAGSSESRRARIKLTLSTADARYTPFLFGAEARIERLTQIRGTTARVVPWSRIEFTTDELGNVEGIAECFANTPELHHIFRRADAPWRLEWTDDDAAETPVWHTVGGGLARMNPDARYEIQGEDDNCVGVIYGTWVLMGQEAQFREKHVFLDSAFDGIAFSDAINNVLIAAGEDPVDPGDMPPILSAMALPYAQAKQNFRFGVNPGDGGEDVLQRLLLLARGQNREFRIRYDWDAQEWRVEQKPKDGSLAQTWVFTPFKSESGVAMGGIPGGQVLLCAFDEKPGQMQVFPVEANVVQATGVTEPGGGSKLVTGYPFKSAESLSDPNSLSYLGRIVAARPMFEELRDTAAADAMSRRIFDIVSVRDELQNVIRVGFSLLPTPCGTGGAVVGPPRVLLRAPDAEGNRINLLDGWLKRRHVAIEAGFCGSEVVTYTIGTRWESGILE